MERVGRLCQPAVTFSAPSCVVLPGRCATAVDGPANVAVGGVERFQGRAAGEFDPLEAELAKFSLLCLADDATVALDAGFAKSFHCCILRLLFGDALHYQEA